MPSTHEVTNQVPPLVGHDVAAYPALLEGLEREGAGWAADELHDLGRRAGSAEAQEWGRLAEKNAPVLQTHDRYGHRVDEVEFDPAWHQLMTVAVESGIHATPWTDERPGAHVARAAKEFVWTATDKLRLGLNIQNVFDRQPYYDPQGWEGFNHRHNIFGRIYNLTVTYKFW